MMNKDPDDENLIEVINDYPNIYAINSIKDVEELFSLIYPKHRLRSEHFKEVVYLVSGCDQCIFDDLRTVLNELERRMKVKENAFWDFQLLDTMKNGCISMTKAECLFNMIYGSQYKRIWNTFASDKTTSDAKVTYDEIEMYLCRLSTS